MIDFTRLDKEELAANGLVFETDAEAEAFASVIQEELQVRIGAELERQVGSRRIKEFDNLETYEERRAWLARFCPEYRIIIRNKRAEMDSEIRRYKSRIAGLVDETPCIPRASRDEPFDDFSSDEFFDDYAEAPLDDENIA